MTWLRIVAPALSACLWTAAAPAQTAKRYIPPPLKVSIPFEAAWEGMLGTLEAQQLPILRQQRGQGAILTEFKEYISGPLTEAQLARIGEKRKLADAEWVRVLYQYDIVVQLIQEKETLVFVNANLKALQRDFFGAEKWVEIPSNGRLENELLTSFGKSLFGEVFALEKPKKGFWERTPGYVPEADVQPQIVGPERKRP